MSLNKLFKTDKALETEGIVIEYKENGKVIAWFKCKRPGGRNSEYQRILTEKIKENRQELFGDQTGELEKKIMAEVYAEAVILGWGGEIYDSEGNPAVCAKDNIVWLLIDEAPDLFIDLQNRLADRDKWQREVETKNSRTASGMKSGGGSTKKR